jgi:hypothetical protein
MELLALKILMILSAIVLIRSLIGFKKELRAKRAWKKAEKDIYAHTSEQLLSPKNYKIPTTFEQLSTSHDAQLKLLKAKELIAWARYRKTKGWTDKAVIFERIEEIKLLTEKEQNEVMSILFS